MRSVGPRARTYCGGHYFDPHSDEDQGAPVSVPSSFTEQSIPFIPIGSENESDCGADVMPAYQGLVPACHRYREGNRRRFPIAPQIELLGRPQAQDKI